MVGGGKFIEVDGYVDSEPIVHRQQVSRNIHIPGIESEHLRNIETPEWKLAQAGVDLTEPLPIAITVQVNPHALSLEGLGFKILSGAGIKPEA